MVIIQLSKWATVNHWPFTMNGIKQLGIDHVQNLNFWGFPTQQIRREWRYPGTQHLRTCWIGCIKNKKPCVILYANYWRSTNIPGFDKTQTLKPSRIQAERAPNSWSTSAELVPWESWQNAETTKSPCPQLHDLMIELNMSQVQRKESWINWLLVPECRRM